MNWDEQWLQVILVMLFGGAPVTVVVMAIMQWRRRYHSNRTKRRPHRSPWRRG